MHVALYSPVLPSTGSANGIVTYTRIMQAALRDAGHRATVFDRTSIEHHDGRVEVLGRDMRLAARLDRLRKRFDTRPSARWPVTFRHVIDHIHAAYPIDLIEIEESFGLAGRLDRDIPVVARLHGPHVFGKDDDEEGEIARVSDARIAAERAALTEVAGLTCPSARMMAATFEHYAVQPGRAQTIYNPIAPVHADEAWRIDRCDPEQLLFVGRFDLRKGADVLLKAFALAHGRRPSLKLVLCGPDLGIRGDDGVVRRYADYAAVHLQADVRNQITFLGPVPSERIATLRRQSMLSVSTSRFEVLAYSLTEGLAAGMPILASDTFGIAEIVDAGVNGLIAPVGDAEAVADAISSAVDDRKALAEIGLAARELCGRLLSPARIVDETVDFYTRVLHRQ